MNLKKKKKKNVGNVNQTMAHIVVIYSLSNHLLTFSCFFPHAFNFQFSWLLPCTFFLFSWPIWLWYLFMFPFLILFHASASHVGNKGINYLVTLFLHIVVQCLKKSFWDFWWYMKRECEAKVGKSWSINVCVESYYLWFS